MPALVLWGGPNDTCVGLNFQPASQNLEAGLEAGGHMIVECIHDCGHGEPPNVDESIKVIWWFLQDHPYWLSDGESPYNDTGLPQGYPEWCAIGAGNAIPRSDPTSCGPPECPF
jgi:hypothetical protein